MNLHAKNVFRIAALFIFIHPFYANIFSQEVEFTSSNLPVFSINTNGVSIPQGTRIPATMGVIFNGTNQRNNVNDPFNHFLGNISIEIRGSSSAGWRKKQYNVETQDAAGNNLNVPLLGFPDENDWILNAPYIDKSLMRNVLIFRLSNEMGQYASRSTFCEVILNNKFQGLYVLLEKIKRDDGRVNIAKLNPDDISGDELTGGYIIKVDKPGDAFFSSEYPPEFGGFQNTRYQYHHPDGDDLATEQKGYIQSFIADFEDRIYGEFYLDPETGYHPVVNLDSFVDVFLLNELSKNVDGYRLSTYMYKEKNSDGGKLHCGPIWDYNLAFGNANYYDGTDTDGWMLYALQNIGRQDQFVVPNWWYRMLDDPAFLSRVKNRWTILRESVLSSQHINAIIDSAAAIVDEAQKRNFQIWPGPGEVGENFWPVPGIFYSFTTFEDEIEYLKSWIAGRIAWIDENIMVLGDSSEPYQPVHFSFTLHQNSPNPFKNSTRISFYLSGLAIVNLKLYNANGQIVRTFIDDKTMNTGTEIDWYGQDFKDVRLPSGVYFLHLTLHHQNGTEKSTRKLVLLN